MPQLLVVKLLWRKTNKKLAKKNTEEGREKKMWGPRDTGYHSLLSRVFS
jgi:hypothetical protein